MQSSWPFPVSAPHSAIASLTRLLCDTSTTVVRTGLPLSCAARGSTRKIFASGEACALSARHQQTSREASATTARLRDRYLSECCITALLCLAGENAPTLDDFHGDSEATEAQRIVVAQLELLAALDRRFVQERAVGAAGVFDLQPTGTRRSVDDRVARGRGWAVDLDVQTGARALASERVLPLIDRPKYTELALVVADEEAGERADR